MHYELTHHPHFGHCATAARDISAGDVVIDEEPLLLIDYRVDTLADSVSAAQAYKRKRGFMTLSRPAKVSLTMAQAPENVRKQILEGFYVPDITQKAIKKTIAYKAADRAVLELRKRSALFPAVDQFSDVELSSFSLLASANAHSFDEDSIALLAAGCKVTHSCFNPNVAVSTRSYRGQSDVDNRTAKHIALRDIKKGDLLFGSYAKLTTSTHIERKKYLMNNKMFSCACQYCMGLDRTRGIACIQCIDTAAEDATKVGSISTKYRSNTGEHVWVCQNCQSQSSDSDALSQINQEPAYRSALSDLEHGSGNPSELMAEAIELYTRSVEVFTWRHTITASCALQVLDLCAKVIDAAHSPSLEDIDQVLHYVALLFPLLEQWFVHVGVNSMDELTSLYLLLSEQLMTLSSLHHDIIPESMDLVQNLLLKARPIIEERRSWRIGHVLEEYYDELLVTLNDLVHGADGLEQGGQDEVVA